MPRAHGRPLEIHGIDSAAIRPRETVQAARERLVAAGTAAVAPLLDAVAGRGAPSPWIEGTLDSVPKDEAARLAWLRQWRRRPPSDEVRAALVKWYGKRGESVQSAEAFEVCEYGRRPTEADLRRLFPFFD